MKSGFRTPSVFMSHNWEQFVTPMLLLPASNPPIAAPMGRLAVRVMTIGRFLSNQCVLLFATYVSSGKACLVT